MATGTPRTVTVQEMAELLGISRNHAFRCVQRGEIPSVRIGRRVLIPAAFIDRLLDIDDDRPAAPRARGRGANRRVSA
jgi:excisionase family DNA binding protein